MRKGMFAVVTAALTLAVAGSATAPAAAQGGKIGVIDVRRILAKSQAGVAAREQLEREKAQMQRQVEARRKEVEALKEELDKKGPLMTADARNQKQDAFDRKRRDAIRLVDDFQRELEKKERELVQRVMQDVQGVIDRIGKEKKYYMIVERGMGVVYASSDADITDEIVKAYDQEAAKVKK